MKLDAADAGLAGWCDHDAIEVAELGPRRRVPTVRVRPGQENVVKTTLLLAEDEDTLQALLEEVLTDAGFDVVLASDGTQALCRLDGEPFRFGAVVTDINLGAGPDGWAVGQRARLLVPNRPVVYVSGHSFNEWPVKGVPNSLFLTKPFRLSQIILAVSTLVAAAGSCAEA